MRLPPFLKGRKPQPLPSSTPQQRFDEAAADTSYSKSRCLRSYEARTVILTGKDDGKEIREIEKREHRVGILHRLISGIPCLQEKGSPQVPPNAGLAPVAPATQDTPAKVSAEIVWVEPGSWKGSQAHLILLTFDPRPLPDEDFHRLEMHIRVWRAGDALQSIAPTSHLPLSSEPPAALDLAANSPTIVLFSPRAVVGRRAGTPTEPFWDGAFRPGDHFTYFADVRAAQDLAFRPTADGDPRCILHVAAYGDGQEFFSVPRFSVAMVVLSEGKPFDLTLHSVSLHSGVHPGHHYLWTPYKPAKFNATARLIPKKQKPFKVDFASAEAANKLGEIVEWCKPYDTKWLGDKDGCTEAPPSSGRACSSGRCRLCNEAGQPLW